MNRTVCGKEPASLETFLRKKSYCKRRPQSVWKLGGWNLRKHFQVCAHLRKSGSKEGGHELEDMKTM